MFTEAKLFIIRCDINQAIQIPDITHIITVMNTIYTVHHIFNSLVYSYQHQSIAISKELRNSLIRIH